MKVLAYQEMYLWNQNLDSLRRVLRRLEPLAIRPKEEIRAYEARLEEIRARLNADFADAVLDRGKIPGGKTGSYQ